MTPKKQEVSPGVGKSGLPKWIRGLGARPDQTYTGKRWAAAMDEKLAIACYIADNVQTDMWSVFFDAGSTLRLVAQAAFHQASTKGMSLFTITNNMDISDDFGSGDYDFSKCDITLHLTGGRQDRNHHALFGELAAGTLANIEPESIIMGISGFTFTEGLFYRGGTEEGTVKRELYTKEVDQRIVVLEHSKLGKRDVFQLKNNDQEAIEALCKNVRDKTLVVVSAPPDMTDHTPDVRAWNNEIGYLAEDKIDQLESKKRDSIKGIRRCLEKRILEVVVVSALPEDPYYKTVRVFPSESS